MSRAQLEGANSIGADLSDANLTGTTMTLANLEGAIGLNERQLASTRLDQLETRSTVEDRD